MDSRIAAEADERTALLADDANNQQPASRADEPPTEATGTEAASTDAKLPRKSIVTFAICTLSYFFVVLSASIMQPATSEVVEEIICQRLYPDVAHGRDPRCKDNFVQGELSFIEGWSFPLFLLPGVVTAVPYGILADTYGRRLGIGLCMLGLLLQQGAMLVIYAFPQIFPIRTVWWASLLSFIGGGATVLSALIFAAVSSVAPGAKKTLMFSYLGAAITAAELIGSPLAWLIMRRGAWLAIYISFFLMVMGAVCALFIPDIRGDARPASAATWKAGSVFRPSFVQRQLVAAGRKVRHIVRTQFIEQRTLGLLLISLLFTTLGKAFTLLLAQYVARRFGWTWGETGLLSSLQGGITMGTTSLIIPLLDGLLRLKWSWTLFEKDIFLAQLSLAIMVTGFFGIGLASTSAVMLVFVSWTSLSKGQEFIMRSLLAQAAGEANVGVVYTTISVLETGGIAVVGPLLAAAFRQGLDWGGAWIGFPFFVAGILVFIGSSLVWAASRTAKVDLFSSEEAGQC
ncbi:Major facilitator superfamily domain, general substrate transporter [Akanthomyces lecanii RCEF 1005]|uniref:Major facilitator superfamily domain, general substrate transporter n=1 Tax=Akanthomyces lecanii RCEF 1005 TaxID=1081108 RepID=A0A162K3E8_CORDF|nr:Major facilitator superfamily domain, general substrate transporter [Akanthomyces lecanii RCEF 1005]